MQIKKTVIGDFQNGGKTSDLITKEYLAKSTEEEKAKEASSTQTSTGMSFFEQSIFAIEEFIATRKKMGYYKQDKYFLALTASSPDSNCATQVVEPQTGFEPEEDVDQFEIDDKYFGIAGVTNTNQE